MAASSSTRASLNYTLACPCSTRTCASMGCTVQVEMASEHPIGTGATRNDTADPAPIEIMPRQLCPFRLGDVSSQRVRREVASMDELLVLLHCRMQHQDIVAVVPVQHGA